VAKRASRIPLTPSAARTARSSSAGAGAQVGDPVGQFGVESIDERGVGGLETGRVAGRARFGLARCRRPGAAEQQNGRLASEAPVLS
jgi:hypothetical protein